MKRITMLTSALLAMLLLFGCTAAAPAETASSEDVTYFSSEDISADYAPEGATVIELGENTTVAGSGAVAMRSTVTISRAGTYIVSGELTDGQIVIEAPNSVVRLVLNNASITCSYSAAVYVKAASKAIITLAPDTRNAFTDGASRSSSESIDAAIYSKADLTLNGGGNLTVNGLYKHGIVSKNTLSITGGVITVASEKTAVSGSDAVKLTGCTLTLNAGTNGIRSGNGDDASESGIYIKDGTYTVSSAGDGIQADGTILINDGLFSITTGGGSSAAPKKAGDTRGWRAQQAETEETALSTQSSDVSAKGIKTGGSLTVNGGTFAVSAYDDALHSNADITINGGSLTLSSGDDGVHADTALTVTGGVVDVPSCYEGLEGTTVSISGGTVNVVATDDAINAAMESETESDAAEDGLAPDAGTMHNDAQRPEKPGALLGESDGATPPEMPADSADITPGKALENNAGITPGKMPSDTARAGGNMVGHGGTEGVCISISGGHVTLCAGGDCVDSNGTLELTGGTVYVSINGSPIIGFTDAALDSDGERTIDGVSLLGTGSSASSATDSLAQPAIVFYSEASFDAGTAVTLADQSGNVLFTHTPAYSFASVLATSPALKTGGVYTLTIGDSTQTVTMSDKLTVIGEGTDEAMGGAGGKHMKQGTN